MEMTNGPTMAKLILKRILMKEILSQYHQTHTKMKTSLLTGPDKRLGYKKAMKSQLDAKENSWEAQTHPDSDQDIEERPWTEVPYSDHETRQALSFKLYQDNGSWYQKSDSQISDDEARQSIRKVEIHGDDLGMPEEEEAIRKAGRNVKEFQLVLAEEEEVESDTGRTVTELEERSINFSGYNKETAAYQQWEDNLKAKYHNYQLSDEEADDESVDTWEDFRLEMKRLVEKAEKETAAQYHQPQKNDIHAGYILTSTTSLNGVNKQAYHHHCSQKRKPAIQNQTIKQGKSSQTSSLQSITEPAISVRTKGVVAVTSAT
ncbi:unnamed protein product [Eruca vesicaria subsp. sativa]|uniref:Uncharacterized protein n=1 Tax=Eruca vesicaria subsp. sativa TaxID=29727 RepID=A0ABC8IU70_ERUVS|nr:unnamed protein product [Eruca vesicaria subsp. sativa]